MNVADEIRGIIAAVPAGQVISYGEIAALVGIGPRHAGRLVGELADEVPWWRVVYADGSPATCHGGRALLQLAAENTPLRGNKVDMQRLRST